MEQVKAYRRSREDKEVIGTFVGREGRDYLVKREDGSIMKARVVVPIVSQETEKPKEVVANKKTKAKIKVDAIGNRVGTMGAYINSLLLKGTTKENAVASISKKFGKDEAASKDKLIGHISFLKGKGFAVIEFEGGMRLVTEETKLKIEELTQEAVAAVYESLRDVILNSISKEA
jgi:hypothetical protein